LGVSDGTPAGKHKVPLQVTLPEGLQLIRQSVQEVSVKVGGHS
jgi:hypothetical protein